MPAHKWTTEIAQMTAEAVIDGLAHAQCHGDTRKITCLLSILPQEKRCEYTQLIQAHSPVKLWALKGKVFAKLRPSDDPLFREFAILEAVRALPELSRLGKFPQSGLLSSKSFSEKITEITVFIDKQSSSPSTLDAKIKQEALHAMTHAEKHGDVRFMQKIVEKLPKGYWGRGFCSWLYRFSPIRRDSQTNRFYLINRNDDEYCSFDLEGASRGTILTKKTKINFRQLLDDQSFADWAYNLSMAGHLEILTEFAEFVSTTTRDSLQDSPPAHRILRAFESEWHSRTEANDYFVWPSTHTAMGSDTLTAIEAPDLGIFAALGYRVGKVRGRPDKVRRFILDLIFESSLPPLNSSDYMRPWGLPGTATRLRRMAYFLAQEIKIAKRKVVQDMSVALSQWSSDYEYLYGKFYVGRFKFALSRTPPSD